MERAILRFLILDTSFRKFSKQILRRVEGKE
jgi:hypothetical protein